MVEISIVVILLITTILVCLPTIFTNTKQAKIISNWKRIYSEVESNFDMFGINDYENVSAICHSNVQNKEDEVFKVIGPYLGTDFSILPNKLKTYKYKYLNGSQVSKNSIYYTRKFAFDDDGTIVAFKMLNCPCTENEPCAVALFDLNGTNPPNKIGEDIFGMFLYRKKIAAFGSELSNDELQSACSKNKIGTSCSEFYLRGGKF